MSETDISNIKTAAKKMKCSLFGLSFPAFTGLISELLERKHLKNAKHNIMREKTCYPDAFSGSSLHFMLTDTCEFSFHIYAWVFSSVSENYSYCTTDLRMLNPKPEII